MKRDKRLASDARPWSGILTAASIVLCGSGIPAWAVPPASTLGAILPSQSGTGSIKGRLVWGGAEAPERKILEPKGQAAKDPSVCAKDEAIPSDELVVDPKTKGVRNAFVYVLMPKGAVSSASKEGEATKVEVDQKNCRFVPHVIALNQDQPLVFKSSDPTPHNIRYSAFTNSAFNQILPPNAEVQVKLVAEKRPIPMACDIHPWMKGYIMVFDHPFFAVTGEDGSFEIKGVPTGAQNLVIWHETKGYVTPGAARGMKVQVASGDTADVGQVKLIAK